MKNPLVTLIALGLASCAAPKPKIIYEVPKGFNANPEQIASAPAPKTSPSLPTPANDGMRLGDEILSLPEESQLRATSPDATNKGDAAVIARPPKE